MSDRTCAQCQRALAPGELQHLHMTRFYAVTGAAFWTQFPTIRMLRHFEQWLRQTQQVQLVNDDLPFLPPAVQDHERLVQATEALRLALGLPHVRSLLDLLDAVLERLGAGSREMASREDGELSPPSDPYLPTPYSLVPLPQGVLMSTATLDLALCLEEQARRQARRQMDTLFPDTGPLRRELYARSLEFFAAGKTHRLRLLLGGNRTSKSVSGCYEDTVHLTGQYPAWWEGRRFDHPIKAWICGTSDEKIKESVQLTLLGEVGAWGTGLLPGDSLVGTPERAASPIKDLVDTVRVQHCTDGVPDGVSTLQFKSYKQGRKAFEASFIDLIHDDEEVPLDIHTEQLLRTMDTTGTGTRDGCLYVTFTPLEGLSATVLEYLPSGALPDGPQPGEKHVTLVGWDDVPHLSEASKASLRATIPAYQLDARTRGIPMLGAGAIFPVPEEAYLVDDFPIPPHWLRAYGMDVGWNRTAAVWGAYDRESDRWTLYHEHYVGEEKPTVHAAAIKAPGAWIAGVIDPAARGRGQADGEQLLQDYLDLGLHLEPADNAVEAGIYQVWDRLATGRLKVCRSLSNWRSEVKLYHRDPKGHIVKVQDHVLDATRYLIVSGKAVAKQVPVAKATSEPRRSLGAGSWMS